MVASTKSINKSFKKDIYPILDLYHEFERKKTRDRILKKEIHPAELTIVYQLRSMEKVLVRAMTSKDIVGSSIYPHTERFIRRMRNFLNQLSKNLNSTKSLPRGYVSTILTDFTIVMNIIIGSNLPIEINNEELAELFQLTVAIWGNSVRFRLQY